MEDSKRLLSTSNSTWIGLFLFSCGWLFLYPAFATRNWWAGLASVASGAGFFLFAFRETAKEKLHRNYLAFLVPLVVSLFFIPFPYSLGPIILSAGIALGCLWDSAAPSGTGLVFGGVVMTVQAAVLPLYSAYATRYHSAGFITPAANLLLRVFGVRTAVGGSSILVQGSQHVNAFAITWEKLALLAIVEVLVGGALILLLSTGKSSRKRQILYLLGTVVVYAVVREVFLTLVFMDNEKLRLFWKPAVTWLSILPLFLLLPVLLPLVSLPRLAPFKIQRRAWLVAASAFLCVAFITGAWGYHDPGIRKRGRVLVDEKHSDWEWTTEKYDTRWYGEKSGYNYYSFYTYLDSYYRLERNFKPLTPEVLSRYDVLIVKTPTQPFAPDEVDSIQQFVKKGGGLFLIGDHTNVFGTSSFINHVAERFGLKYNYDATYDLATGALSEYDHPRVMPHPIVQRMPRLLFGTSCSLQVAPGVRSVISGYRLKSNHADYSQKNFFPEELDTTSTLLGSFVQAAALNQGRGRVFAFTDSTIFSNFWMFVPGKPELALGSMEWLNRKNGALNLQAWFLALGLVFLLLTVYLAVRDKGTGSLLIVLTAGLLAFSLVSFGLAALDMATYAGAQPRKKIVVVTLERDHCDFALPSDIQGFKAEAQRQVNTFYVWNQRLGYIPSVSASIEDATGNSDMVVIFNPVKEFSSKEKSAVLDYVKRGGRLLVLDGALNRKSTANDLLELFGMRVSSGLIGQKTAYFGSDRSVATTDRARSVEGGEALLETEDGRAVFSITQTGKGVVGAFADSHLFSDARLGGVSTIPDDAQRRAGELEFWMLRTLLGQK